MYDLHLRLSRLLGLGGLLWLTVSQQVDVLLDQAQGGSLGAVLPFVGVVSGVGLDVDQGALSDVLLQEVHLWLVEHGDVVPVSWAVLSWLGGNGILDISDILGRGVLGEGGADAADDGHLGEVQLSGGGVEVTDLL